MGYSTRNLTGTLQRSITVDSFILRNVEFLYRPIFRYGHHTIER
jgi:hypothetical protein